MTFNPAKPFFMGKLRFQSTNATGQKYYLSYTPPPREGHTLPALSAVRADSTTLWTSYDASADAGQGAVYLVAANGMYLSVLEDNQLAILVEDASLAAAITLVPAAADGPVQWSWSDPSTSETLYAYYQFTGPSTTTLSFQPKDNPPPDSLSTLAKTTVTFGLATILEKKSAVSFDLSGVNLTGVCLSGVDCTNAHFDHAILSGTDFSGATLTGATFTPGASPRPVDLTGVVWGQDISAAGADFSHTIGIGMVVPSTGTPTAGKCATFDSATFTGADWSGCDLTNASLHNAFVSGANFSGATLSGAYLYVLQAGKSNDGTTVPGANFSYAYMPSANLASANLNGANLSHVQLYELDLPASLENANLTETDLSGADLTGAKLGGDGATIEGTNFEGAILFGCTFDGVTLGPSANGIPVTMVGASLENATFTNTSLSGVNMSGARVAVDVVKYSRKEYSGVPLFTISSNVAAYAAALDQAQLPNDFIGPTPDGLFACQGCALSSQATVSVVAAGQAWTLTQAPTLAIPGVEDVGYLVVMTSGVLEVYAWKISLVEQGDNGTAYALTSAFGPTALDPTKLSPDTCCPNRCTKAINDARKLSWQQMVTAPRLSLADLDSTAHPPRWARRYEGAT